MSEGGREGRREGGIIKAKGRTPERDLTRWITRLTCLARQAGCEARKKGREVEDPCLEEAGNFTTAKVCLFCVFHFL